MYFIVITFFVHIVLIRKALPHDFDMGFFDSSYKAGNASHFLIPFMSSLTLLPCGHLKFGKFFFRAFENLLIEITNSVWLHLLAIARSTSVALTYHSRISLTKEICIIVKGHWLY